MWKQQDILIELGAQHKKGVSDNLAEILEFPEICCSKWPTDWLSCQKRSSIFGGLKARMQLSSIWLFSKTQETDFKNGKGSHAWLISFVLILGFSKSHTLIFQIQALK